MAITIRTAVEADQAALHKMLQEIDLFFRSLEPDAPSEDHLLAHGERKDYSHTVQLSFGPNPFCTTLIAELDNEPVGYLAYHDGVFNTDSAIIVAGLFVRKAARKSGVGRALMTEIETKAAKRGATFLAWTVWHENTVAKEFYRKFGGKVYADDFVMIKRVAQ